MPEDMSTVFTSHYVTINSIAFLFMVKGEMNFTSHYVTINSDTLGDNTIF